MTKRIPFTVHVGVAAPLLADNVDTDQIIPSREMKAVSKSGLGEGLFAGQRYLEPHSRALNPEFVLNKAEFAHTTILLSSANFGCGSSREHAVWALKEFGIRCIIAESFGEIFHGNCARNGILPVSLTKSGIASCVEYVLADPQENRLTIDLETQTISASDEVSLRYDFDVDPYQKRLLLGGLDPIGLTLTRMPQIDAFEEKDRKVRPWIYA